MTLSDRIAVVKRRIADAARRSGRSPDSIRLVAVTKTVGPEDVRSACSAGLTDFGENRWPDAEQRVLAAPQAVWHFIGSLQKNKASKVLHHFRWIHSIDSLSLLQAISARVEGPAPNLLFEVNVSGEESKHGVSPGALSDLLHAASSIQKVNVVGLMTMAPLVSPEETRPVFKSLRELFLDTNRRADYREPLRELSMGMTNDFEVAVEEGATIVRIGTAIFGPADGQPK
jgi:hypothetical protein